LTNIGIELRAELHRNRSVPDALKVKINPSGAEEAPKGNMGSSISGMASPAFVEPAMPQTLKIDRAGCGRVRIAGRA